MAGGYFGYDEYKLKEIANTLTDILNRQGQVIYKHICSNEQPETYKTFPQDVQAKMKELIIILNNTYDNIHMLDLYLSSDTDQIPK
jgi:hypothetical protein